MKNLRKNICKGLSFMALTMALTIPFANKTIIPINDNSNTIISANSFNPVSFIRFPFGF